MKRNEKNAEKMLNWLWAMNKFVIIVAMRISGGAHVSGKRENPSLLHFSKSKCEFGSSREQNEEKNAKTMAKHDCILWVGEEKW